jgi:hypothetical protein
MKQRGTKAAGAAITMKNKMISDDKYWAMCQLEQRASAVLEVIEAAEKAFYVMIENHHKILPWYTEPGSDPTGGLESLLSDGGITPADFVLELRKVLEHENKVRVKAGEKVWTRR